MSIWMIERSLRMKLDGMICLQKMVTWDKIPNSYSNRYCIYLPSIYFDAYSLKRTVMLTQVIILLHLQRLVYSCKYCNCSFPIFLGYYYAAIHRKGVLHISSLVGTAKLTYTLSLLVIYTVQAQGPTEMLDFKNALPILNLWLSFHVSLHYPICYTFSTI